MNIEQNGTRYHVIVNGHYFGDKLPYVSEDRGWYSLIDYLRDKEFQGYHIRQEGDVIYVDVEDEEEREAIKDHMAQYRQYH